MKWALLLKNSDDGGYGGNGGSDGVLIMEKNLCFMELNL